MPQGFSQIDGCHHQTWLWTYLLLLLWEEADISYTSNCVKCVQWTLDAILSVCKWSLLVSNFSLCFSIVYCTLSSVPGTLQCTVCFSLYSLIHWVMFTFLNPQLSVHYILNTMSSVHCPLKTVQGQYSDIFTVIYILSSVYYNIYTVLCSLYSPSYNGSVKYTKMSERES